MRIDELLAAAAQELSAAGIAEAELDARLLLQYLTGLTRSQVVLYGATSVDDTILRRYRFLVEERRKRVPLQYLMGSQEFWSMDFTVSPAVLIPRPETEFLLELVMATCSTTGIERALDLCTGSGAIAVVLAKEFGCPVVAADISEAALRVAAANFSRHGLCERVLPVCSDLFSALAPGWKFDVIVSNPPYIAEEEIDALQPEVFRFEPRLALSGGPGGMQVIERIASEAPTFLQPGGWLFLEIGADQEQAVTTLFRSLDHHYGEFRIVHDWAGRPRVLQARQRS